MSETPTKSYIINGHDGAVKLYFDSLVDGERHYLEQYETVEFSYSVSDPNHSNNEETQSGFELIQKRPESDTWLLAGYVMAQSPAPPYITKVIIASGQEYGGVAYFGAGAYSLNGTITANGTDHVYDGLATENSTDMPTYFQITGGPNQEIHVNVPFPIFDSLDHAKAYILTGSLEGCYNHLDQYELDTTQYYFIYNLQSTGVLFNGKMTEASGATRAWHSLKFGANGTPVLYYDNAFGLTLYAPDVVNSKAVNGPGYIIDNIPEEGWTQNALEYSGPFYATLADRIETCGSLPANGTYSMAIELNTNILRFPDEASAQHAIETGDYTGASNYYEIQNGNTHAPITTGADETATTFGSGPATSPFVSSYICTKNAVLNIANVFYTNDTSILDNLKKGLELMGANPYEALCSLNWYPFSLSDVLTALAQNYIYFGSYKYEPGSLSVDKVQSYKSNGYINAGSLYVQPIFNNYRDLDSKYTNVSIYLPYHGWEPLDIAKYYKKTINVRYYCDVYTNTYAAALVVDNQIADVYSGNIGQSLPLTGSNMSEYANSMLRSVLGTGAGILGGATTGLMAGSLPGAVIGAGVGAAASLAGGVFEMSQKGAPKDHLMVKGAFSGGSAGYMPQYVILRYEIHNLIVPANLTELYGRPSSASGPVSQFSGFLKCDTFKLNTSGMLEEEVKEIETLLKTGIFA